MAIDRDIPVRIVEDDAAIREMFAMLAREYFGPPPLAVAMYEDGQQGLGALLAQDGPTFTDDKMPKLTGPKMIEAIAGTLYQGKPSPFFRALFSAGIPAEEKPLIANLFNAGHLHALVEKPFNLSSFLATGSIAKAALADPQLLAHLLPLIRNPGDIKRLGMVPESLRVPVLGLCTQTRRNIRRLQISDIALDPGWKDPNPMTDF